MANPVDQLIVEIRAETKSLRKGLDDVNRKLGTANKTAKSSVATFGNLAKVFAAVGAARLGGAIANTAREFQDLEATLKGITGSAESAASSFDLIKQFTATTTFQVQNVASAFTTLVNAGIAPTSDVLQDFGNFAAGAGKDITQMAQAVFNATTGEMEMLKQFGVIARVEGDKLAVNFRGSKEMIGRDADSIVAFLRKISQENFSTALEERANTASGAISNLKDAVSITMAEIGEGGLLTVLTEGSLALKELAEKAKPVAQIFGGILLQTFNLLKNTVGILVANMNSLLIALSIFAATRAPAFAALFMAKAMGTLRKAILGVRAAMLLLQKNPLTAALVLGALAIQNYTSLLDDAITKMKEVGERFAIDMGFLNPEQLDKTDKSVEELNKEIEDMLDKMTNDLDPAMQTTAEFTDELEQAVTSASNAFTTQFVDSLLQGQSALQSFKDFSRNIVSQIIAIFLQLEVVNRILAAIFPNFQGTVGTGLFGGGTSGATASAGLSGSGQAGMGGMPLGLGGAGGGAMYGGQARIVGERGPEIFVPHTSGNLMNNMNSKNAMGGGGTTIINQSINFATGIVPTVRAEVMKMMPQIADVTKGAVAEAAVRGGSYRRALQGG